LNTGDIYIDSLEKIAKYFDCKIVFNNEGKFICKMLVNKQHYWLLSSDPYHKNK